MAYTFLERRPWGWFLKLFDNTRCWVKILRVRGRTSLQSHDHRTELILKVSFPFRVLYIPRNTDHRLSTGWYFEVAWGKVEEKDVIRYKDDYGRA